MACDLTRSRAEACKDAVAGLKEIYLVDFGNLGAYTYETVGDASSRIDDCTSSETFTVHKYELKGNNSFETTINASRENGTTFYEQVLTITLKKLNKEDNKELKLLTAGRPHIFVRDYNDNVFLMGKDNGCDVTAGTMSTGSAMGDFNGYNLTFTAMEVNPPNFVEVNTAAATFPISELAGLTGTVTIGTPVQV